MTTTIKIPKKLKTEKILKKGALLARKHGITLKTMLIELDKIRHHK